MTIGSPNCIRPGCPPQAGWPATRPPSHGRAQQQLLPLAPDGGVRRLGHKLPAGFRLSVKAPRGLTHGRRLYAPETWIGRIMAGWHELGDKRAVLLVQLAPSHAR